ncbi:MULTISPECIES: D-aminoacyl-tRNA deacylase [Aliiglaciecola]|uniref:D-aminoacyl-tRNA deacylase n=1 Tax=Aliiglaciecola TaxID=1406885 RepID=UPI001C083592|nr:MULTISPECIES: D-aminoacyl-tRNA deacylase [Aliiglaciecola]MBU2878877.1 D-tyrosyl-tRNA(Tyr) deacylase [Aliiglaciecola lipolytica]MDO6713267.1 D-aminoacyl-tRNA deacylase [Aliiglaciecola sp. 2_MG-2023]MDO6754420.1 D-aminoacyl-tRNA deacylase [Aliiglaciecola sp. 1_MG-2023]
MIALIQRVTRAHVEIDNDIVGKIDKGMMLLLGVEKTDTLETVKKLANKLIKLRMFSDADGKMNLNIQQFGGAMLIVSQFTLVADTRKGNRPGFSDAAPPELGKELYQQFVNYCQQQGIECQTGEFGADMQVSLVNDGPVTFHLQIN